MERDVQLHNEKNLEECPILEGTGSWKEKNISIEVKSIENIDKNKVKDVSIKVEFKGQLIDESDIITIPESGGCETNFSVIIPIPELSAQIIDDIVGHPLLFRVIDRSGPVKSESDTRRDSRRESKRMSSRTSTPAIRTSNVLIFNTLGVCNMDLSPLIKGKKLITDTLVVELEKNLFGANAVAWLKLPRIVVTASTGNEELIPHHFMKFNNILSITVESIYNAPSTVEEGTTFEASILVPSFSDKLVPVVFSNGLLTCGRDSECSKQWSTLSHIEGRGALTKFKISQNICEIINPEGEVVDLEKTLLENGPRIQWNKLKSSVMVKTGSNYFFKSIAKNGFWPLEISLTTTSTPQKSTKSEKRIKTGNSTAQLLFDRYVAYLRLGALLYPGTTKVRVASRLYTYSASDITEKCGADFVNLSSQTVSNNSKIKIDEKSKTASKEVEDKRDTYGVPLFNENGRSVFIIVEVEVWRPYLPKREPETIMKRFSQYFPPKAKVTMKQMNLNLARKNYSETIQTLSVVVNERYKRFLMESELSSVQPAQDKFFETLCQDEVFRKIKTSLEHKILDVVGEKYGDFGAEKEKIPEIFIYLVDEMRRTTNSFFMLDRTESDHYRLLANDLQLSAEEAIEEENFNLARRYLLQKIMDNKLNPDYWLDYALYLITIEEYEKCVEAVREALLLDIEHQMGLLMYALILAKLEKMDLSELTFQVLLAKYPDFIEGWFIFSLFYKSIGRLEDAEYNKYMAFRLDCEGKKKGETFTTQSELAQEYTSSCASETSMQRSAECYKAEGKYGIASFSNGKSVTDPLSWTMNLGVEYNVPEKSAVLLLRLRAFEFAELALVQEPSMEKQEQSLPCMYYLAVNHYLRGQFTEAILHLERAVDNYGKNYALWALIGHCYYKLQQYGNCIQCFEYVIESFCRPDDIHLIYLRTGIYYMMATKYHCAKRMFLCGCKYSPSSEMWLGLGSAYYHLGKFDEAELALTEANYLDYMCPVVWAYLTLVNIQLERYDLVELCYSEAKKKNLRNEKLIKQIETLMEVHRIRIASGILPH